MLLSKMSTLCSRLPVHQLLCDTPTAPRRPRGLPAAPPQDLRGRAQLPRGRTPQRGLGGRRSRGSGPGRGGGQLPHWFLQGSCSEGGLNSTIHQGILQHRVPTLNLLRSNIIHIQQPHSLTCRVLYLSPSNPILQGLPET